jgi:hypothetical protein
MALGIAQRLRWQTPAKKKFPARDFVGAAAMSATPSPAFSPYIVRRRNLLNPKRNPGAPRGRLLRSEADAVAWVGQPKNGGFATGRFLRGGLSRLYVDAVAVF